MQEQPLGILVGGSSHVGKSTFARTLASTRGWELISTDDLGRHPGRPWPSVRPQVAEYYASLTDETIHYAVSRIMPQGRSAGWKLLQLPCGGSA